MALKQFESYLQFGGKIDPLSEILNAGVVTSGSVFWVKATTDSDYQTFKDQVGAANVFNDIQSAINKCRNDKNDYVMVCPQDGNAVWDTVGGTAIYLNKARVHLISVGYTKAKTSYTNTIRGHATASAYDNSILKIHGAGCEVAGFRVLGSAGTTANGTMTNIVSIGTSSAGSAFQPWIHDCLIENTQAAGGGASGTANLIQHTASGVGGIRLDNVTCIANATGAQSLVLANNTSRNAAYNCTFVQKAIAVGDGFVFCGTGATDYTLFENCTFINLNSGTANTSVARGSTTTNNYVIFKDCAGINVTAFGTDPAYLVVPNQSGTAGSGVHNPGIAFAGTAPVVAA